MKKIIILIINSILHFVAIAVVILAFRPLAQWYLSSNPLWGVDFYYTATLVKLLQMSVAMPAQVWNYFWFTGGPFLSSYPILHYYLILPFTLYADIFTSIKFWMIISTGMFFVGNYLVFYQLAKDQVLAAILAIISIYSIGTYGALTWGGSLPSSATQAFYPLVIFFILKYFETKRSIHFRLATVLTGLAIWGHPQIVIAYIYPTAALLFALTFEGKIIDRLKKFAWYFVLSFLIGLPLLYQNFGALKVLLITDANKVAQSTAKVPSDASIAVSEFFLKQPLRVFTDTQPLLFWLTILVGIVYILNLITSSGRKSLLKMFPFVIILGWYMLYVWMFGHGISIYHGGWYRLFWAVSLWFGMLASVWWGAISSQRNILIRIIGNGVFIVIAAGFLLYPKMLGIYDLARPDSLASFLNYATFGTNYFKELDTEKLAPGTLSLIVARSQTSSAFPDILNIKATPEKINELKKQLVPTWLNPERTDYRLYGADQTVNIWWNALYKMPLARGYLDPASEVQKGYVFWADAALNQDTESGEQQLVHFFNYPVDIAQNNALFLIDWYGLKFFEAGHAGPTVYSPLPNFLTEKDQFMLHDEAIEFTEKYNTGKQELHYYEIKDEYVSPILAATNAYTLGVVASDSGYEVIVRALADGAFNSTKVIPVKLGRELDKIRDADYEAMDALILYDYNYDNRRKALGRVTSAVKKGKKVFVETGVETKESNQKGLHELFPLSNSERKALGDEWDFTINDEDTITQNVDFGSFSPPIFDREKWNFAYPITDDDIRDDTKVILENHGKPVMLRKKIDAGEVIWSGMNLPYHVTRFHNPTEIAFFANIINELLPVEAVGEVASSVNFVSPLKREVTTTGARGVLFKEQSFAGWHAKVIGNGGGSAQIYSVGPSYPGFMYVRLPKGVGQAKVTFTYWGDSFKWLLTLISLVITILVLEEAMFGGWLLGKHIHRARGHFHFKLKKWWGKEDE